MSLQTTLLTGHKGVDLHAATALRVMRDRLEGGDRLLALHRCEMHTVWDDAFPGGIERLLDTGRFYNPNKHHYGVFTRQGGREAWLAAAGHALPTDWPGRPDGSDLAADEGLYDLLLGGAVAGGAAALDVATFPRGETGPVLSGVLWRLVLRADEDRARPLGENLAVARHRKAGLLLNPHMEDWLSAVRAGSPDIGS